jgi:hypothetical protein
VTIPKEVKRKEKEIIEELKKEGFRVFLKINNVDSETGAWEHDVKFYEVPSKEDTDKVWSIIRRHYEEWKKSTS